MKSFWALTKRWLDVCHQSAKSQISPEPSDCTFTERLRSLSAQKKWRGSELVWLRRNASERVACYPALSNVRTKPLVHLGQTLPRPSFFENSFYQCMAGYFYIRTFAMVSGNRSATRPPPTSTDEANRMGMALVMPTREPKIRFPNAAESLHRALQNPKPVPLGKENKEEC